MLVCYLRPQGNGKTVRLHEDKPSQTYSQNIHVVAQSTREHTDVG